MSPHLEFSPANQALIDTGRRFIEQKVIREAEAVEARHEMHLNGDAENCRLAEEAFRHANLMTSAAFLEMFGIFLDLARAEVAAERMQAA